MEIADVKIPARDGYTLAGKVYLPDNNPTQTVLMINSATAVPQRYYKPFATHLAEQGYTAVTHDFRGIGQSKPEHLRGFKATAHDWALQDMAGVVDWVQTTYQPKRLFFIGHSFGGQTAGLLPNGDAVDAMITVSSQSGHWRMQGGNQVYSVAFHVYFSMPLLAQLFGYMPWSKISSAEDLPKGVALEWAKWCRYRGYLLDDTSLPLDRYQQFQAPVLAYSIDDDDWGTSRSVDAMMRAYPNLTREHIVPADYGIKSIGHFGFFRPKSKVLWQEAVDWLETAVPTTISQPV